MPRGTPAAWLLLLPESGHRTSWDTQELTGPGKGGRSSGRDTRPGSRPSASWLGLAVGRRCVTLDRSILSGPPCPSLSTEERRVAASCLLLTPPPGLRLHKRSWGEKGGRFPCPSRTRPSTVSSTPALSPAVLVESGLTSPEDPWPLQVGPAASTAARPLPLQGPWPLGPPLPPSARDTQTAS